MVTKSSLWTQLANAIAVIDETFQSSNIGANSFLTRLNTLTASFEGNHVPTTSARFQSLRTYLNSVLAASTTLDSLIIELARIGYASQNTTVLNCLSDIYSGMVTASETVKERGYTFGTPSFTGTGDGQLYRITTDKTGQLIEKGYVETGQFEGKIIQDATSGTSSGAELLEIYGIGATPVDTLEPGNHPITTLQIPAIQSANGICRNGDFVNYSLGGATYTINYWDITQDDAAYVGISTTEYYRKTAGGVGQSCIFLQDNKIEQDFSNFTQDFDTSKPVSVIVRFKRLSSCDGQLILSFGGVTEAFADLTLYSAGAWHDIRIGITDESDCWFDNFNTANPKLGIELNSRTTGSLAISDVIVYQPESYDGTFYTLTAGSYGNDFLKNDLFEWTDLVSNTGRIQTTLARLYSRYLPSTSGTPTYSDA